VKLDFPHEKKLSAAEKKQNESLAAKYGIQGFPTIIVLDDKGAQLGKLGYQKGGAKPWIAGLEKVIQSKKAQ